MSLHVSSQGPHLTAELDDGPTRNALSEDMVAGLLTTLARIEHDPSIRSLILRGAGGAFCAGADLKGALLHLAAPAGADDPIRALNQRGGLLFARLDACPVPVIALVDGPALGGGLGLVCCADIVLATQAARFGLPETGLGLPPAQIAPYLVGRLGPARARRLALTGERLDAAAALDFGLVDLVCGQDEAETQLAAIVGRLHRGAPAATRATKLLLRQVSGQNLGQNWGQDGEQLAAVAAATFADCLRGPEGREGVAAFAARRPPAWAAS